jgi:capsular exopolysaccharide synthesis family protein
MTTIFNSSKTQTQQTPADQMLHDALQPILGSDIEYTHTQIINTPSETLRSNRVITSDNDSVISDSYRILRSQILLRMRQNGWNSIAVTSPTPGSGSTLSAINLAISIAQDVNHTVLLVDLDLRKPSIHKFFTDKQVSGLSDYLLDSEVPGLMFNPGIDRLVVLPGNTPIADSSEMLGSPKMLELIKEVKSRYDSRIVIFDLPPMLSSDDVLVVAPHVDAILMVVRNGHTKKKDLQRAREMLKGFNVIGTLFNASNRS